MSTLRIVLIIRSRKARNLARRVSIFHFAVIPCLFLTLMLGPTGLVTYLMMRWRACRKLEVG